MANIMLNIEGDLNIFLGSDSVTPCCMADDGDDVNTNRAAATDVDDDFFEDDFEDDDEDDDIDEDDDEGDNDDDFADEDEDDFPNGYASDVLFACPGLESLPASIEAAMKMIIKCGGVDCVEPMPAFDLLAAFNSDCIIRDRKGNIFLAGPIFIFRIEDFELVPLTLKEIEVANEILTSATERLDNGHGKLLPVFAL